MGAGDQDSGCGDVSRKLNPDFHTVQLVVAYDGTAFQGFQRLKSGRTVQGTLEYAWRELTGLQERVIGAGRTDSGVHAFGQSVSIRTQTMVPTDRLMVALNGRLPSDVRVRCAKDRSGEFHARFSAGQRSYQYIVRKRGRPSVFWDRYSLLETGRLDLDAMEEAARGLLGSHDFRSFGSPEPERTSVRDLRHVRFREWHGWLFVNMTANAFLKGMARTIVAQFLEVGRGDATPQEILDRLQACDRGVAGKAAPPNGLFLARVDYGSFEDRNHNPSEGSEGSSKLGTQNLETV